ncbi:hypothetical protein Pcinc_035657 [Petrolisthes cinctipes]|uniref:Uncharacterized protein n=1 Tax=Petrolisthes cinctipes TaxID=88211 RepID=A0AAE1ENE0_PETCI|nr:hypothetical protein Pcinc_035657 [Petrolisthes cinctipes]
MHVERKIVGDCNHGEGIDEVIIIESDETEKLNEKGHKVENYPKLVENNPRLAENNPRLAENNPKLVENNPRLVENNPGLVENNPRLVENNPGHVENNPAGLVENNPKLVENNPKLVENNPRLVENNPKLVENNPRLVESNPKLVESNPKLVESNPKLVENNPRLVENNPKLVEYNPKPVENNPRLVANDTSGNANVDEIDKLRFQSDTNHDINIPTIHQTDLDNIKVDCNGDNNVVIVLVAPDGGWGWMVTVGCFIITGDGGVGDGEVDGGVGDGEGGGGGSDGEGGGKGVGGVGGGKGVGGVVWVMVRVLEVWVMEVWVMVRVVEATVGDGKGGGGVGDGKGVGGVGDGKGGGGVGDGKGGGGVGDGKGGGGVGDGKGDGGVGDGKGDGGVGDGKGGGGVGDGKGDGGVGDGESGGGGSDGEGDGEGGGGGSDGEGGGGGSDGGGNVAPIGKEVGERMVAILGGLISALAIMLTAFANSVISLLLCFSVVAGEMICGSFGSSLAVGSCFPTLAIYFNKRRGLANAFLMAGISIGQLVNAPLIRYLQEEYGNFGAILIVGAIILHTCVGAALFQPVQWHLKPVPRNEMDPNELNPVTTTRTDFKHSGGLFNTLGRIVTGTIRDLQILKQRRALLIALIGAFSLNSHFNFIAMVPFAMQDAGHSLSWAAWVVSATALTNTLSRILVSIMADHPKFPLRAVYVFGIITITLSIIGWTFLMKETWPGMVVMAMFGCGVGIVMGLHNLAMVHIVGVANIKAMYAVNNVIVGLGFIIIGPLVGMVRDMTESYAVSMCVLAGVMSVCVLLWCLMPAAVARDIRNATSES